MSIDAMNWAWRQRNLTVGQKLVLLALADRASETHSCWPSMTRLCQDTGLSDRGIRKIYIELEALKLIRREHRSGQATVFTLLGVTGREVPPEPSSPRNSVPPEPSSPRNQVPPTPEPSSGVPRTSVPPEPKEEPKENPKKKYSAPACADAVHAPASAPQADETPAPPKERRSADTGEPCFLTRKRRKLAGKRLTTFEAFWADFGLKKGKAEAADAWLDIPELTDRLVARICDAARQEAQARREIEARGGTPKWAQGWLTARRWEDYEPSKPPPARLSAPAEHSLTDEERQKALETMHRLEAERKQRLCCCQ
ncbi:helix-turn-helix domain-containing protein [Desulfovibrio sp.]|uniref:helix-turn-helix domain-containing protein n=1 Tax=Desulfovibrio sp. TaxID=885 RepID=UPI0023BC6E1E|nr:helix-turn-helix domain-containing protein [Desulfovibrio sp.]MDE7241604.1 helix-turn-helix domain-containing protein [Desulfovibrio sp.]